MRIVNIIGGLGNQMFQYAFALSLKNHFPDETVMIDTHHFNHYPLFNGFELDRVFPFHTLKLAAAKDIRRVSRYIPHYKLSRLARRVLPKRKTEYIQKEDFAFEPIVYTLKGNVYYDGYWQGNQYYEGMRDILRKEFTFPTPNVFNKAMCEEIESGDSVGIHVRRGDYLNLPLFKGICGEDYYENAIDIVRKDEKTHFYVFSNDIKWCEEHIAPLVERVTYITDNKGADSFWDMFLLSKCRQLIIANSSFSWWGAFLNADVEKVIAPKQWVNTRERIDTQMPEWTLI